MFQRFIQKGLQNTEKSVFLLGPRQVGKSTLISSVFPDALVVDLLKSDLFRRLISYPEQLRDIVMGSKHTRIVIDEIQLVPALLNEVHYLMEKDKKLKFVLTGSSARKLRSAGVNLLGGRARRFNLCPITTAELEGLGDPKQSLLSLIQWGGLPSVLTSSTPIENLKDYVGTYLKEEIKAESLVRSLENFNRFLDCAALMNTEQVNFAAVASDVQMPSKTVQEYFQILEDTLLGSFLSPYRKTKTRKAMASPKFYLFDMGVANAILGRWALDPKTPEFGKALEHLVWRELSSFLSYSRSEYEISYWRSELKFEVDFIVHHPQASEPLCAIEVKSKQHVLEKDLKGLQAFSQEFPKVRKIAVSFEPIDRTTKEGVEIHSVYEFFKKLWRGEIIPVN